MRCRFCHSTDIRLENVKLSEHEPMKSEGLIRDRYKCNSCGQTDILYRKPTDKTPFLNMHDRT